MLPLTKLLVFGGLKSFEWNGRIKIQVTWYCCDFFFSKQSRYLCYFRFKLMTKNATSAILDFKCSTVFVLFELSQSFLHSALHSVHSSDQLIFAFNSNSMANRYIKNYFERNSLKKLANNFVLNCNSKVFLF